MALELKIFQMLYFVPCVNFDSLMVGDVIGLGGKLILTVSCLRFDLLEWFSESPSGDEPTIVPLGGRGGFMEPEDAGFGAGC